MGMPRGTIISFKKKSSRRGAHQNGQEEKTANPMRALTYAGRMYEK